MTHIVYRISDSVIITPSLSTRKRTFATKAAATRSLNAMLERKHRNGVEDNNDYGVAEIEYYKSNIEQMVTVRNLMSGKEVTQSVNTPASCDVSCETYWSM